MADVKTMDQLRAEFGSLTRAFEDAKTLDGNKLAGALAMCQVALDHLEHLEHSAARHRALSHEHMRNGDTRMSLRAKTLAQEEDRLRKTLLVQLSNAWIDSVELKDELKDESA